MLLACSCQRYLLRTVGGVVGECNVARARAFLGWLEGDREGAIGTSGNRATVNAWCHSFGFLDGGQREVAAGGKGGDVQRCIAGVSKFNLLCRAGGADRSL